MTKQEFLDGEKMYMNPATGSVDLGAGWVDDFLSQVSDDGCPDELWDLWGGNSLVEVVKDGEGEWVEGV